MSPSIEELKSQHEDLPPCVYIESSFPYLKGEEESAQDGKFFTKQSNQSGSIGRTETRQAKQYDSMDRCNKDIHIKQWRSTEGKVIKRLLGEFTVEADDSLVNPGAWALKKGHKEFPPFSPLPTVVRVHRKSKEELLAPASYLEAPLLQAPLLQLSDAFSSKSLSLPSATHSSPKSNMYNDSNCHTKEKCTQFSPNIDIKKHHATKKLKSPDVKDMTTHSPQRSHVKKHLVTKQLKSPNVKDVTTHSPQRSYIKKHCATNKLSCHSLKNARYKARAACVHCHNKAVRCEPHFPGQRFPCKRCVKKNVECKMWTRSEPKKERSQIKRRLADRDSKYKGVPCKRNPDCIRPHRHTGHCKIEITTNSRKKRARRRL